MTKLVLISDTHGRYAPDLVEDELPGLRTRFVNASMLDERYTPAGDAFTFTLE